jgi:hypothetical protein
MSTEFRETDRYALIEGPRYGDAEFYGRWLLATARAEELWKIAYAEPEFESRVKSLCIVFIPDFGIAGAILLAQLLKNCCTARVRLESELGEEFTMMVGMGFFVLTGNRYQMAIPPELTIEKIKAAVLEYAETEYRYAMHPERLINTMSLAEAKDWQRRLRQMDERARLADRQMLLEEYSSVSPH